VFGSRIRGAAGAAAALIGLMGPPVIIVTLLGVLYAQYGNLEWLQRILAGIAAAAAGLIIAVVAKMARPLFTARLDFAPFVALAAFVAIGLFRWPLPLVLLVLAPLSIALAWMRR
jgi:chromate transporter